MIDVWSNSLAHAIKSKVPNHPASIAVLKFGIAALLNISSIIILSLALGALLGTLFQTVIVLVSFAVLRQLSGGYHLKSGVLCIVISTTGIVTLSLVPQFSSGLLVAINVLNAILTLIFAPSSIEKQSRINKKYYPLLKVISTLVVLSNFWIGSSMLGITFLVQCLTLINKPFNRKEAIA